MITDLEREYPTSMGVSKGPSLIRVILRGQKFEIPYRCALERAPGARLATVSHSEDVIIEGDVLEITYDQCPLAFQVIQNFYLGGKLHLPDSICTHAMIEELEFWELEADLLPACCWEKYEAAKERDETLDKIRSEWTAAWFTEALYNEVIKRHAPNISLFRWKLAKVHLFLEIPISSIGARIWSIFYIGLVILSVGALCMDTVISWRTAPSHVWQEMENITSEVTLTTLTRTASSDIVFTIEIITLGLLTFESLARLVCAPVLIWVLKCPILWLSVVVLIPSWVVITLDWFTEGDKRIAGDSALEAYVICSCLRPLRLILFMRLKHHYRAIYVLIKSLQASWRELALLFLFLSLGVGLYGNLIYFIEIREDNVLNVPQGFWWALITMTTVGYGDTYPVSAGGCIVGGLCAVTGIIIIALPIPVIASNFNHFYVCSTVVEKQRNRDRAVQERKSTNGKVSKVDIQKGLKGHDVNIIHPN